MAAGFVEDDGDGGGEVERAGGVRLHGDAQGPVGLRVEEGFGEATGLRAENEEVAVGEIGVPEGFFRLGAQKPTAGCGVGGEKLVEGVPELEVDVFPVIESGAADGFFVE